MDRICKILLIVYFATLIEPLYAMVRIDPEEGLVLSNDYVRFEFEPVGMGLCKMVDLRTGYNHIEDIDGKHLLWEVAFGVGRQIYTITNNYKPCSDAYIEKLPNGGQKAVLEWKDLRWWNEDKVVIIQVAVELPADDGVAQWHI